MIETKRLILKPLTYEQLIKYSKADNSLEEELGVSESGRIISDELREALEQTILPSVADPTKNYLFSTLWTAIAKETNQMVGDLCFYGEPNEKGEIEVGYGVYEAQRNKGYMTELLCGMISWAETQANVVSIFASTDKDNYSSYKVLQNNNFIKSGETDTLYHWQLTLKTN
jgi:[ribosomal protein S5]-alanine N-acetyltransferase